jgi:DUF1680 family protein
MLRFRLTGALLFIVSLNVRAAPPRLEPVPHEQVDLRGGFWGPRLETHHAVTVTHVLDNLEKAGHIQNFDIAAGTSDAEIRGHHAYDSDLHKALEGAIFSLQHKKNPELRKRVESILDRILAAQQKDGYLISYFIAKDQDQRWQNMRLRHQLYNAGHFFEMAVAHHRLTKSTKALDAARRFADHIAREFGPGKRYEVPGHQEIELALVKLAGATGERKYLDLCRFFLEERGHAHGTARKPFDYTKYPQPVPPKGPLTPQQRREARWAKYEWRNGRMQDHIPVAEQHKAVGHAVRAGYMYAGMADLARRLTRRRSTICGATSWRTSSTSPAAWAPRSITMRDTAIHTCCRTNARTTNRVPPSRMCCGITAWGCSTRGPSTRTCWN